MSDARHHGLDWLRVAAFALLIVYHVAMVFAPWHWVIKSPVTYPQLIVPMALLTPWRLPLLFAVSGFASRRLLAKLGGAGAFLRERCRRLLLPLGFGLAVLLPPELWIRARANGYLHGLLHYWTSDYWSPVPVSGIAFPAWEHLWFVAYLWVYTMLLGVALWAAGGRVTTTLAATADWLAIGRRLVWTPAAALVVAKLALLFVVPETQGLTTDWAGHAEYLPIFLFGFALGSTDAGARLWPAIARAWPAALAMAVLAGGVVVAVELAYQGHSVPPHAIMAADRAARLAMAWSVILLLLHVAETRWRRDGRWRRTLAEAVFPFYLVHHPALVVLAWTVLPLALPAPIAFAVLLGGTAAACALFYLAGRRIGWLRPLIGLAPLASGRDPARRPAAA